MNDVARSLESRFISGKYHGKYGPRDLMLADKIEGRDQTIDVHKQYMHRSTPHNKITKMTNNETRNKRTL